MLNNLEEITRNLLIKLKKLKDGQIKPDEVSIDEYDHLRDLCGEKLQVSGFDENYNPTQEGKF